MDTGDRKRLEKLQKEKLDAERRNKLTEVSELCNGIGEIFRKYGFFKEAVEEYNQDLSICETYNDTLGAAIACRMLSECYCDLGDFNKAIQLQKRYLSLARSIKNTVEEQRAWATIGRTYLFQAETDEGQTAYSKAEEAFIQALELCESMKKDLSHKEYMTMKARLFLNMGVVQSGRNNFQEFKNYMERCISIARTNGLDEELFRCQYLLADHYISVGNSSTALKHIESAMKSALKMKHKQLLTDSYLLKFQICFEAGQYGVARHSLKKLINVGFNDDRKLKKFYRIAQKSEIVQDKLTTLKKKFSDSESLKNMMKQYEMLADYSVDLSFYKLAIRYYLKVLELGTKVGTPQSDLVPIYMSLAQTYQDDCQYENAIEYYQKELDNIKNNPEQSCQTLINLGINQEIIKMSYEVIKLSYLRALNFAREAKNVRLEQRVLKLLVQAQELYKQDKDKRKSLEKLKELQAKHRLSVEDSGPNEEEDKTNSNDDDDEDEDDEDDRNPNSEDEDDVEISDLTESEEDEEEIRDALPTRRTNTTRFKVKRNEKGETPLHRACIEGNLKRVELLIKQGQLINVRDYCGWMPIHEAANLGFHHIVEVLIKHGAHINDVGGRECGHVTPLIDAATNGNIEVMQVLLNHGADLTIKDARDRTALTSLMEWRQNCDDVDEETEQQYQSMVRYLQEKMGIKDVSVLRQKLAATSKNWCSDNSDDNDSPPLINETSRKKRNRRREKDNLSEFIEDDNSTGGSSDSETELCDNNDRNNIEEESATDAYKSAMSTVGSSARQRLHRNECSSKSLQRRKKGGSNKTALISSEKYVDGDWLIEDVQPSKRKRLAPRSNYFTTGSAVRNNSKCKDSSSSITATRPGSSTSSVRRFKSRTYSVIDDEDDDNSNHSSSSNNSLPLSNLGIDLPNTIDSSIGEQHPFSSENRFGSTFIPESNQEAVTHSQIFHQSSDLNLTDAANFTDSINRPSTSTLPSSSSSLQLRTDSVSSGMVQKVYIKVGTLCFCVPLSPSDRSKTILWLNQETSRRVYAQCQLKPILSLTTKSGALLDPDDKISMVIENGEELEGCVASWDLPPVQDRYTEACKNNKTVVVRKISQQLEQCETSGDLTLPHMALTPSIVLPVFRAIKYQNNLCLMNLTGNRLGDVGLQSLAKVLNTVPSLTSLDISCNGITLKGLKELNGVLEATYGPSVTGQQDTVPWGLAKKPLQKLESLNLSYNHLTDECSDTLMVLLRHLPALTHLAIASCQLSHTLFEHAYRSQPSLTSPGHMRSCYLQHMDVSCNKLESAGVHLLFKWLDPTQLVSLDLSWTSGYSSCLTNQLFCNSLMNFLPLCEEPKLQKLSLAGCDLSLEDGNLLVRLPYFATRLQTLDLSCNPQFEQPILLQLLQNASSNAECALEQIVMMDCGISSPLTSDLLDSLGNKLSATFPLVKLYFSCVKLDAVDRNSLKQVWCGHWGDLAVCNFRKGDIVQLSA